MLFKKGVITHLEHEKGEFISPIFVRAKLDEEFCMTLNLKALKKYVEYKKFKMHIISSNLVTVTLNMYIAILDIKDVYDSMPTHESHKNYWSLFMTTRYINLLLCPMDILKIPESLQKPL